MRGSSGFGSEQIRIVLWGVVFVVIVGIGIGLIWFGFALGKRSSRQSAATQAPTTAAVAVSPLASPTSVAAVVATHTPLPTVTPLPTATPTLALPTATSAPPMVEAGPDGLNIRSGPGLNFTRLAHVDPGTQLKVIGRYADWWQIEYNDAPAWVYSGVVTAYNVEGIPEVQPPPSPTSSPPPPATDTPVPATPAATQAPDTRGVVANNFWVEGSSPYGNAGDIWFNFDVSNTTSGDITYSKLGAWVKEKDHFQVSWGVAGPEKLKAGQRLTWRDHLYNEKVNMGVGTYNLYLRICFADGYCVNLAGPIEVTIG